MVKALLITQNADPSERVVLVLDEDLDSYMATLDRSKITRLVIFTPEDPYSVL